MSNFFTSLFEVAPPVGAEDTAFDSLKELGKSDLGVLKQVTFLNKQYHGDDPRLTSKESQVAMSSVLSKLFYTDDRTAYFMGQMEWKPNIAVWMRFFDIIGDAPLGKFFGIANQSDLPNFGGGGINPPGGDTIGDIFSAEAAQGGSTAPAAAPPPAGALPPPVAGAPPVPIPEAPAASNEINL